MSQTSLAVIAVAAAVMALVQVSVLVAVLLLMKRLNDVVSHVERLTSPVLSHIDDMSREVVESLALVRNQLNRAEEVASDFVTRADRAVDRLQTGLSAPVRQGAALLAGARAVLRAFRRPSAVRT